MGRLSFRFTPAGLQRGCSMKKFVFRVGLALLVGALSFSQVAQSQQRRRTSRRVTHPVRSQATPTPNSDEPAVVSTADDQQSSTSTQHATPRATKGTQAENEQLRGTVKDLSSQVEQ